MSRRYGRYRCSYGTWHDLDEACTCATTGAVLAAAFPEPGRIAGSNDVPCGDYGCGCRTRGSRAAA